MTGVLRARAAAVLLAAALAAATLRPAAAAAATELPPLARAAVADLVLLDAVRLGLDGASPRELALRLPRGEAAVRAEQLRANRDADPILETTFDDNAALLLQLRVLEAIAFHLENDSRALEFAGAADSLANALHAQLVAFARGAEAVLPLAAGLVPVRARVAERRAEVRQLWALWAADGGGDIDRLVLAAHVAALAKPAALEPPHPRGLDPTRAAVLEALATDRIPPFLADDPARRLLIAVRLLHRDGAVSAAAFARARDLARRTSPTPDAMRRRAQSADSLEAALASAAARPMPIHGSRRNYYRKAGEAAPSLAEAVDAQARDVARDALHALRAADADAALAALGLSVHADPDPFEVVPEQALATVWTVHAAENRTCRVVGAQVSGRRVGVTPASATVATGTSVPFRTAFASIGARAPGDVVVAPVELELDIADFGRVTVHDRIAAHVVAPVQATLVPADGVVIHGDEKIVDVIVTSRAPYAFTGALSLLPTHDWTVSPAAAFRFTLRRPGQSARQSLRLVLPRTAAPGDYELALRIDAEEQAVGTLRTRLVKPVRWALAGPFARPPAGARLAPENGVSLEARYPGLGGAQIAWQAVPDNAYEADGSLDLGAMLAPSGDDACACAFTVLESAAAGTARVDAGSADRVRWNGVAPGEGGLVRIERGRNLLLVRSCRGGGGSSSDWRLGVTLRDPDGAPLHILANDLVRLLNGYAALVTAAPQRRGGPVDRLVTVRFAGSAADVHVLGSFNAWVPLDLERQPDGTWQRDLRLSPGRYAYKLLVDGKLRSDPEAPASEADGFGGRNSLLIVK